VRAASTFFSRKTDALDSLYVGLAEVGKRLESGDKRGEKRENYAENATEDEEGKQESASGRRRWRPSEGRRTSGRGTPPRLLCLTSAANFSLTVSSRFSRLLLLQTFLPLLLLLLARAGGPRREPLLRRKTLSHRLCKMFSPSPVAGERPSGEREAGEEGLVDEDDGALSDASEELQHLLARGSGGGKRASTMAE